MGSVAAALGLLFFEQEKSFSVCMQREALDGGGGTDVQVVRCNWRLHAQKFQKS